MLASCSHRHENHYFSYIYAHLKCCLTANDCSTSSSRHLLIRLHLLARWRKHRSGAEIFCPAICRWGAAVAAANLQVTLKSWVGSHWSIPDILVGFHQLDHFSIATFSCTSDVIPDASHSQCTMLFYHLPNFLPPTPPPLLFSFPFRWTGFEQLTQSIHTYNIYRQRSHEGKTSNNVLGQEQREVGRWYTISTLYFLSINP